MNNAKRFERLIAEPRHADADLKNRTARAGTIALGAEVIEFCIRVSSLMVLARLLVPEHFGLIAMVTAITSVVERFKDLGLSIATVQRRDITHEQVSSLFWVNAVMSLILSVLTASMARLIADFYGEDRLFLVTLALCSSFVFGGITVQHQALLRRQLRFGHIATVQIASSLLSVVVAVVLALLDYGYWALVAREVSRSAFMAIGTWMCVPWVPGPPARGREVRSMIAFGGDVTAFNLVAFIASSLDQVLIGKLFGATPLGLYRQGVNLVLAPLVQLTYPVNSVAESTLSRLQGDGEKYRRYYKRILSYLAMASMPIATFLAVYADEIVRVALGPKWLAAAEYFRILAVAAFLRPVISTPGFVMITQGWSRRYLWWGLTTAVCGALFLIGGTHWGPLGIAYAHVAATYAMALPMLYWGLKGSPISLRDFLGCIYKPVICSIVMAMGLSALKQLPALLTHPLATLVMGAGIACPLYLLVLLLLPGGRPELARLWASLVEVVRPDKRHASQEQATSL